MATKRKKPSPAQPDAAALLQRIREIWNTARSHAARSVNSAHVLANWLIGQQIVEAEQGGKARASYGKQLLKKLSADLGEEYGSGFSVTALKYMRMFYLGYPQLVEMSHAVRDPSKTGDMASMGHALRDVFAPVTDAAWQPGRPAACIPIWPGRIIGPCSRSNAVKCEMEELQAQESKKP